jgi:hypothetical protein
VRGFHHIRLLGDVWRRGQVSGVCGHGEGECN